MLTGSMQPRHLNRKMKQPEAFPGFLVERDERWYRNANSSCTKEMINSSASFKPSGTCHISFHRRGINRRPFLKIINKIKCNLWNKYNQNPPKGPIYYFRLKTSFKYTSLTTYYNS
jgi:hypothetical protein